MIKITSDIFQSIDRQQCVFLILLDLSAAFDTLDTNDLLVTLEEEIGVRGVALEWFRSYLSNRKQTVNIHGYKSEPRPMLCGVPQGSVLGPVLFIIFTKPLKDIAMRFGLKIHLYADDTQIYISFETKNQLSSKHSIEACLDEIHRWMSTHFLKVNPEKTEFLIIGTKQQLKKIDSTTLTFQQENVTSTLTAKNIGAILDSNMSFSAHIKSVCSTSFFHLHRISKIKKYLNPESAEVLVHSFISSKIDYHNAILFGLPKYLIQNLQHVQNSAARLLTNTRKHQHISPILKRLHWLPVSERIKFKILLITYKALHDKAPEYIKELLITHGPTRNLRSTNKNLLTVPAVNLEIGRRSFAYSAPFLWNSLPLSIRLAKSVESFKSQLKTHLFNQAYSSQ
ncbi:hypothetical protein SNE40_006015 [Patella caerulea]|uniref:Reverse transcriptase domain-containing protein n=1 Tax=Patella caerulea TaxID=87958 RepID=A0AAN8JW20_PATCE